MPAARRGRRRGGGREEGRGLGSRARAGPRATQLRVLTLRRSAPPAADKGWEDACAPGCTSCVARPPPERLRPPPVSDFKDHSISLAASPHPPRLAFAGARALDPQRGWARHEPRSTGSRCLRPVGLAGELRLLAGVRGRSWDPTPVGGVALSAPLWCVEAVSAGCRGSYLYASACPARSSFLVHSQCAARAAYTSFALVAKPHPSKSANR